MPTDESYLDSLLNGLSSDTKEKNDRLSAYRKGARKDALNTAAEEEEKLPEPGPEEISEEPEASAVNEEPEEAPWKFDEPAPEELKQYLGDPEPEEVAQYLGDPEPEEVAQYLGAPGDFDGQENSGEPKASDEPWKFDEPEASDTPELTFHSLPEEEEEEPEQGNFFFSESTDGDNAEDTDTFNFNADNGTYDGRFEPDDLKSDDYNIFDDYDDAAIDRMIDEELSAENNGGEPFVVHGEQSDEDNGPDPDDGSGFSFDEPEPQNEETEDTLTDRLPDLTDDGSDLPMPDISGAEPDPFDPFGSSEEPAAFTEGAPLAENDPLADSDPLAGLDTLSESDPLADNDPLADTASADESDPLADIGEASDTPGDEAAPAEEDPLEGFVFDSGTEESPQEDAAGEELGAANVTGTPEVSTEELLGAAGLNDLDEKDIQALDNLFNEVSIDDDESEEKKPKKKKENKPWYVKLFGNVKIPEDKIKPEPTEEELAAKKAEAAEAKKAAADAKKAEKDEKKKAAAEAKAEKARRTKEEKDALKAKKREELSKLILEDTDNTTRLNKAGVTIIFAVFVGIAALIISGSSNIAYRTSIKQAERDYNSALKYGDVNYYSDAYDHIYGLTLDEKDYELGEKIYTVNFVSAQISAFNNHYATGDYTSSLNDLFKGLLRYNKWIPYAIKLGAEDDLYFVRTQILGLLDEQFGISEEEAMTVLSTYAGIVNTENEASANLYYTKYIYSTVADVGLENQTNN